MDDQKFESLMAAINKLDTRSDRMETKIEKVDDRLRELEISGAGLNAKFDTQFPHIQLRLNEHVSDDTEYFHSLKAKVDPLVEQHKNWKKELWGHRVILFILIAAIATTAPQALLSAIKLAAELIK